MTLSNDCPTGRSQLFTLEDDSSHAVTGAGEALGTTCSTFTKKEAEEYRRENKPDSPLSNELRSQIAADACQERTLKMGEGDWRDWDQGKWDRALIFYKKLAIRLGIESYVKCFGVATITETWRRLCLYEGELPPPDSIEKTVRKAAPKHLRLRDDPRKTIPMKEYSFDVAKAQINTVTDIAPESILELPILPLSYAQKLPKVRALFFVMASETEPKVIYVGKTQDLKASWKPIYVNRLRFRSINAYRRREVSILKSLGIDIFIRWIPLPEEKKSSVWQADVDDSTFSLWLDHANRVLQPFFLGKEIEGETTLAWDSVYLNHWNECWN